MRVRPLFMRNFRWLFIALCLLACSAELAAQQPNPAPVSARPVLRQEGIFLVFPFENAGAPPRLDWIGEGLEELTIQGLSAAGQAVYSHTGRLNQMDSYGMPSTAKLSRATMLHIAQELDADYVVFGNFASDGKKLTVNARLLRVNPVALLPVVLESAPLESLMDLHFRLVWRLLGTCDRSFPLNLAEFKKLQRPITLAAFEQYIRGLLANDDEVRLRDLKEAARLEPEWPSPAFALGEIYFSRDDCASALPWFAKVPASDERSVEAVFSSGVCRLRLGQPDKAEAIFTSLQENLHHNMVSGADLPEILNNLALARARQSNFSAAQTALGRARDIDPGEDDYPFNLGLLSLQTNDLPAAATHFREAVHREPDKFEDRAFLIYVLEKSGKKPEAAEERESALEEFGPGALPTLRLDAKNGNAIAKYERIKRELDTTTLRLELRGPDVTTADNGGSDSKETPADHVRHGRQEVNAGRLDAAEKEFHAALASDPHNASAHRELAEVYRLRGKLDDAVNELQLSLAARDSAAVHTTLARIYLVQKKPELARAEAEKAVKLAPNYPEAKELLQHLEKSKPPGGVQ